MREERKCCRLLFARIASHRIASHRIGRIIIV
jgi:hypothetical protein